MADKEPWEVAFENSYPPRNDTPRSREDFRAGFEAGQAAVEEFITELQANTGNRREWWSGGTWIPLGYRLALLPAASYVPKGDEE